MCLAKKKIYLFMCEVAPLKLSPEPGDRLPMESMLFVNFLRGALLKKFKPSNSVIN